LGPQLLPLARAALRVERQQDDHALAIGKPREETTITVETMVYDLSKGAPVWAGASRTTDPKNVQTYIKRLVSDVAKRLERDGLITKNR